MLRRSMVLPLVVFVSALAGCGGGKEVDDESAAVEDTIVTASMSEDPADCKRLNTQELLERAAYGFVEGEAAVQHCEELAEEDDRGEDTREVVVSDIRVESDQATAEAAFVGGAMDDQTIAVALVRVDGQWKLHRLVEFVEFDRDRLLDGMEPHEEELGVCLVKRIEGLEDHELQNLVLHNDPAAAREMIEACVRRSGDNHSL